MSEAEHQHAATDGSDLRGITPCHVAERLDVVRHHHELELAVLDHELRQALDDQRRVGLGEVTLGILQDGHCVLGRHCLVVRLGVLEVERSHGSGHTVRGFHPAGHLAQTVDCGLQDATGTIQCCVPGAGSLELRQILVQTYVQQARVGRVAKHLAELHVTHGVDVDARLVEQPAGDDLPRDRVTLTKRSPRLGVVVLGRKTRQGDHERLGQVLEVVRGVRRQLLYRGQRQQAVLDRGVAVLQIGRVVHGDRVEHVLARAAVVGLRVFGLLLHGVEQLVGLRPVLHVCEEARFSPGVREERADHVLIVASAVFALEPGHTGVGLVERLQVHIADHRLDALFGAGVQAVIHLDRGENFLERFRLHLVPAVHAHRPLERVGPAVLVLVGTSELASLTERIEAGDHVVARVCLELLHALLITGFLCCTQLVRLEHRHEVTKPLERSVRTLQGTRLEQVVLEAQLLHEPELDPLHALAVGEHVFHDLLCFSGQAVEQLRHLRVGLHGALRPAGGLELGVVTPLLLERGAGDELVDLCQSGFRQLGCPRRDRLGVTLKFRAGSDRRTNRRVPVLGRLQNVPVLAHEVVERHEPLERPGGVARDVVGYLEPGLSCEGFEPLVVRCEERSSAFLNSSGNLSRGGCCALSSPRALAAFSSRIRSCSCC